MEAQDLFDRVAKHLLTQKAKAMRIINERDHDERCAYRGADGKSCAVGCLIDDDEYQPWMEGQPVDWLLGDHEKEVAGRELPPTLWAKLEGHTKLLLDLQFVHDENDPLNWELHLREVAKAHNLEFKGYT